MLTGLIVLVLIMANVGTYKVSEIVNGKGWITNVCLLVGILYFLIIIICLCILPMERVRKMLTSEDNLQDYHPEDVNLEDYNMGDNFVIVENELRAKSFAGFVEGVKYVYNSGGYVKEISKSYICLGVP